MARSMTAQLWFDYRCPYAWFSLPAVRKVIGDRPLHLRPFRMPPPVPIPPVKAAWIRADRRRQAEWHGVAYRERPEGEGLLPDLPEELLARSVGFGATEGGWTEMERVFRAIWTEGSGGTAPGGGLETLPGGRLSPKTLLPGRAPDWEGLRRNDEEAAEKGVFGAPTLELGEEEGGRLIWGADRIEGLLGPRPRPEGPGGATLDFYFDFSSPFAYLAATGLAALAGRHRATLRYRPILLGALFREVGNPNVPLFAMSPARQRWVMDDIQRQVAALGVPFTFSPHFPLRTVGALRAVLAEEAAGVDPGPLVARLFRAAWVEGLDVGDPSVLGACGARLEALDAMKAPLRAATDEARALGVFGVPSFRVDGGEIAWGNDRLPGVEVGLARGVSRLPPRSATT